MSNSRQEISSSFRATLTDAFCETQKQFEELYSKLKSGGNKFTYEARRANLIHANTVIVNKVFQWVLSLSFVQKLSFEVTQSILSKCCICAEIILAQPGNNMRNSTSQSNYKRNFSFTAVGGVIRKRLRQKFKSGPVIPLKSLERNLKTLHADPYYSLTIYFQLDQM